MLPPASTVTSDPCAKCAGKFCPPRTTSASSGSGIMDNLSTYLALCFWRKPRSFIWKRPYHNTSTQPLPSAPRFGGRTPCFRRAAGSRRLHALVRPCTGAWERFLRPFPRTSPTSRKRPPLPMASVERVQIAIPQRGTRPESAPLSRRSRGCEEAP